MKYYTDDWSKPIDGIINVPDEYDPLINKIGTQIRFHTISGKSEPETVCHIARIAETFFLANQKPDAPTYEQIEAALEDHFAPTATPEVYMVMHEALSIIRALYGKKEGEK